MTEAITAEQIRFYEQNGYLILRQWLSMDEVKEINQEYHILWMDLIRDGTIQQKEEQPLESVFPRLRDYHQSRDSIAKKLLSDKNYDISEALLAESALAISTSYYFKGPGTRGLPMHQDNHSVGAAPGSTCSLWTSLSTSNPENGGIYVIPGSHRLGLLHPEPIEASHNEYGEKLRIPSGYEELALDMLPGDIVAFHGNLMHGSYANVTKNQFRHALVTHFTGVSAEMVSLNYQYLINRSGDKVRRRLNMRSKLNNDTLKKSGWSGVGGNKPWERA